MRRFYTLNFFNQKLIKNRCLSCKLNVFWTYSKFKEEEKLYLNLISKRYQQHLV
jgi:hypothetical protein